MSHLIQPVPYCTVCFLGNRALYIIRIQNTSLPCLTAPWSGVWYPNKHKIVAGLAYADIPSIRLSQALRLILAHGTLLVNLSGDPFCIVILHSFIYFIIYLCVFFKGFETVCLAFYTPEIHFAGQVRKMLSRTWIRTGTF